MARRAGLIYREPRATASSTPSVATSRASTIAARPKTVSTTRTLDAAGYEDALHEAVLDVEEAHAPDQEDQDADRDECDANGRAEVLQGAQARAALEQVYSE